MVGSVSELLLREKDIVALFPAGEDQCGSGSLGSLVLGSIDQATEPIIPPLSFPTFLSLSRTQSMEQAARRAIGIDSLDTYGSSKEQYAAVKA